MLIKTQCYDTRAHFIWNYVVTVSVSEYWFSIHKFKKHGCISFKKKVSVNVRVTDYEQIVHLTVNFQNYLSKKGMQYFNNYYQRKASLTSTILLISIH